jgi:hypothetical protein
MKRLLLIILLLFISASLSYTGDLSGIIFNEKDLKLCVLDTSEKASQKALEIWLEYNGLLAEESLSKPVLTYSGRRNFPNLSPNTPIWEIRILEFGYFSGIILLNATSGDLLLLYPEKSKSN